MSMDMMNSLSTLLSMENFCVPVISRGAVVRKYPAAGPTAHLHVLKLFWTNCAHPPMEEELK